MSSRHPGWKALAEAVAPGARVTRLRRLAGAGMTDAYDVTLDRALFRRDYGGLFLDLFPYELTLLRQGYLSPEEGWDHITWWLFERS